MQKLTIVFGPTGTVWPLMYKTEEAAKEAMAKIVADTDPVLRTIGGAVLQDAMLVDDFSQTVRIPLSEIKGIMLEDMEVSKLAHIEHQVHVWRVQASAQQTATTDPILRSAAARQGPAVITPQGANGFGPRF